MVQIVEPSPTRKRRNSSVVGRQSMAKKVVKTPSRSSAPKRANSSQKRTVKKTASTRQKVETKTFVRRGASDHGSLPSWKELEHKQNRRAAGKDRSNLFLETVSTAKMALLIIVLAAGFTAYVGHVHATQELLSTVQDMREDNMRLHLKYNRVKGHYDKLTGPETIHRRAQELGLTEGFAFGQEVTID